ncbi:hypothetical protein BDZ89DRAFT_1140548 [Hymenopellis radicata]|nr:hypothetical protein BDZ89DRAFT_1140548 [Hymenopellis radicata]
MKNTDADLNPVESVLNNADLLSVLCNEIVNGSGWDSKQKCSQNLLSLAMTTKSVSSVALDALWRKMEGFMPLLRVFPEALTPDGLRVLPDVVTEETWLRFDEYAGRIRVLSLDERLRKKYSPTVYLRLAQRNKILLPNLLSLEVDASFASNPAIMLIHGSPRLSSITITMDPAPEPAVVSAAISALSWNVVALDTLSIGCPTYRAPLTHNQARPVLTPLRQILPPSSFTPFRSKLSKLSIEDYHPMDYDHLVALSSLADLWHLSVVMQDGVPETAGPKVIGFLSLTSLNIKASVIMMPRILRLLPRDVLRTLSFVDSSGKSYPERCEAMQEFHLQIASQYSLNHLDLLYKDSQIPENLHASSRTVFQPLMSLKQLHAFTYDGALALDDTTMNGFLSSWLHLKELRLLTKHPVSSRVLPRIAASCSDLVILALPVKFAPAGPLDNIPVMSRPEEPFCFHLSPKSGNSGNRGTIPGPSLPISF